MPLVEPSDAHAAQPQIWIEGAMIGGYEDLADWHGQGKLDRFRTGF
jgi:uncharacterized protein